MQEDTFKSALKKAEDVVARLVGEHRQLKKRHTSEQTMVNRLAAELAEARSRVAEAKLRALKTDFAWKMVCAVLMLGAFVLGLVVGLWTS